MKKACVIGHPIGHSRSPLIHRHWLQKYGIAGDYEKRDVPPEHLSDFIHNLEREGYVGCNVTIPHKEAALKLVPHLDDIVQRTGSLNTIYMDHGKLIATSTDGEGFYQNLIATHPDFDLTDKTVIVLGAGGSAKAIIERLLRQRIHEVLILNRSLEKANQLQVQFGPKVRPISVNHFANESKAAGLLINTTSLGMKGQPNHILDLSHLPKTAIVADIVYVPLKTQLIGQAETLGLQTVYGLGMLLHQAVVGFEKWFGVRPKVTKDLYDMIARDVDPTYHP